MKSAACVAIALATAVLAARPAAAGEPHEFISDAKALLVVGACADGPPPDSVDAKVLADHCKKVREAQDDYKTNWIKPADAFMAAHVPHDIPKTVVYPFAGGDLSTALTVFPDADEITTLSLEPAGDARALARLTPAQLKTSLAQVAKELGSLYRSTFSVTMNMIETMRGGQLPTQLIFGLSALWLHGYEPVSLRYFKLDREGELHYISDDELATIDKIKDTAKRNRELSNIELRFHKTGSKREQVYRHIMANLDDAHIKADPSALKHLEKKGTVSGMTKAASYLLTFDEFSKMRHYVIDHVTWMISDTTGLAPTWGTPAGFEYETYGTFASSNMAAGGPITPVWKKLFDAQPHRDLAFRFGYPDGKYRGYLVIMRKATR